MLPRTLAERCPLDPSKSGLVLLLRTDLSLQQALEELLELPWVLD